VTGRTIAGYNLSHDVIVHLFESISPVEAKSLAPLVAVEFKERVQFAGAASKCKVKKHKIRIRQDHVNIQRRIQRVWV